MDDQTYQIIDNVLKYTSAGCFWAGLAVLAWTAGGIVQDIKSGRYRESGLEDSAQNNSKNFSK